ncbi:MAG TPA: N-acetylmuramoyl-L-alanine amidase, partial [Gemmatimonadaceae bacterium]|nr:N-acetylmuramoyl-L-alanine amidase [Gemmatimonadaceae bacterium]
GALIQARDSTFVFGSVGHGGASLTVNGAPVPVHPNGAWIAYLPVPPRSAPHYELVVVAGLDTARQVHPVAILPHPPDFGAAEFLLLDTVGMLPAQGLALPDSERVEVSIRAPASAELWLEPAGVGPLPLIAAGQRGAAPRFAREVSAALLRDGGFITATLGTDTARLTIPAILPIEERWAELGAVPAAVGDTDRVITGRPVPAGTYKWFFLPGTRVRITGRQGDFTRVRLDDRLAVWVSTPDVTMLAEGVPAPRRLAGNARVVSADDWVDLVIPMGERPPHLVEQLPSALQLTLYGTRATTDIIRYPSADTLVRRVRWEPVADDRVVYTVELGSAPYGYLVLWREGALVLRVRRPPAVEPSHPLRGLTIAVDAGHPPGGATGPTGLREAEAALAIASQLQSILESRGAIVHMTRTSDAPVPLGDRPVTARRANAHAMVSIHLNALPDGVNPFAAHGTGTYFFHPQAEPLARYVQAGMVRRMGLRDLGVYYDNLALARPTWMPSVLCEGAFLMIPEQEAALRTPEFQRRYALGVADGLERYFRSLARSR